MKSVGAKILSIQDHLMSVNSATQEDQDQNENSTEGFWWKN